MTASVLHQIGLDWLIADSRESYVQKAVELAADVGLFRKLRGELRIEWLRQRYAMATDLRPASTRAYRGMWREWCSGNPTTAS